MLFLGDVATLSDAPTLPSSVYDGECVLNLEGPLTSPTGDTELPGAVFSWSPLAEGLRRQGATVGLLANNHSTDLGWPALRATETALRRQGIRTYGSGADIGEAQLPLRIATDVADVHLIPAAWPVIDARPATTDAPGVAPLVPRRLLGQVAALRESRRDACIVVTPHWDYEQEPYPLPYTRHLARLLIEAGANAIVGTHSHCPQGVEFYRGGLIVYSLGNWAFDQHRYMSGRLTFAPHCRLQLAVDLNPSDVQSSLFSYYAVDQHGGSQTFLLTERMGGALTSLTTPYGHVSQADYSAWYSEHRRRTAGIPAFLDPLDDSVNAMKANFVRARALATRLGKTLARQLGFRLDHLR